MDLNLSDDEATLLRELVEAAYRDLKEESYKAEDHDFKRVLAGRKVVMESLLTKLGSDIRTISS